MKKLAVFLKGCPHCLEGDIFRSQDPAEDYPLFCLQCGYRVYRGTEEELLTARAFRVVNGEVSDTYASIMG